MGGNRWQNILVEMSDFRDTEVSKQVISHAHADIVPGTVYLSPEDTDVTKFGQAIYPVPSADPNDPLRLPQWRKEAILICVVLYSLIGNATGLAPSVYILPWATEFGVSPNISSKIVSYGILAYGVANLVWVPFALKFGRRTAWLSSLLLYVVFMAAASQAKTYEQLLVFHILGCFGAGICESVAVMIVDDCFFLHERGAKIGYYTASLCLAGLAPVPAGYMLDSGTWRLLYYILAGLAGALFVLGFFIVIETRFDRSEPVPLETLEEYAEDHNKLDHRVTHVQSYTVPLRKSYLQQINPWSGPNPKASFWISLVRSFTYLSYPAVLWTICAYGIFIGTGALFISYSFPTVITAPPYNWPEANSGLVTVGGAVGVLIGLPIGPISDRVAARLTRKNNGVREPEMRLLALLPAMLLTPGGLLCYGLTAYYKKHWIGMFIGNCLFQGGAYMGYVITLSYTVDCYNNNVPEMLAIICACKQTISFGMGFSILEWITNDGIAVISGIFAAILTVVTGMLIVFWFFGKNIRRITGRWKVAQVQKY